MRAVWIEIPVQDLERALAFYRAVFELPEVDIVDEGVRRTATLVNTTPEGHPGISLNKTANFEPSDRGTLAYFDTGTDMTEHVRRVQEAGGTLVLPKTSMGDAGSLATILDTEGNLIALYCYP